MYFRRNTMNSVEVLIEAKCVAMNGGWTIKSEVENEHKTCDIKFIVNPWLLSQEYYSCWKCVGREKCMEKG